MLERVPERHQNAIGIEWLFEEVIGPELGRLHRGLNGPMTADHDDDRVRIRLLEPLERFQSIDAGHLYVHEDQMGTEPIVLGDRIHGVARRLHFVSLVLEKLAQRLTNPLLVIDHEDAAAHRGVDLYRVTRSWPMRTSAMKAGTSRGNPSSARPGGRDPRATRCSRRGIMRDGTESSRSRSTFTRYCASPGRTSSSVPPNSTGSRSLSIAASGPSVPEPPKSLMFTSARTCKRSSMTAASSSCADGGSCFESSSKMYAARSAPRVLVNTGPDGRDSSCTAARPRSAPSGVSRSHTGAVEPVSASRRGRSRYSQRNTAPPARNTRRRNPSRRIHPTYELPSGTAASTV